MALIMIVFAVVLMSACSTVRAGPHMQNCFPDNTTKSTCFSSLPESAMPWPSAEDNTYSANQEEAMDYEDYSINRVQSSPSEFCRFKDQVVEAISCMSTAAKAQCPHLPDEMLSQRHRLQLSFDRFCNNTHRIDPGCMLRHWSATKACYKEMPGQGGEQGSRPPRPPKDSPYSQDDSRESQDDSSESQDDSRETPDNSPNTSDDSSATSSDQEPGSRPPSKSGRPAMSGDYVTKVICGIKYRMMRCVKQSMVTCHQDTAEIMATFVKDMSSEACAAMMERWELAETGCQGLGCVDGASGGPVAWATFLLPVGLVVARQLI